MTDISQALTKIEAELAAATEAHAEWLVAGIGENHV